MIKDKELVTNETKLKKLSKENIKLSKSLICPKCNKQYKRPTSYDKHVEICGEKIVKPKQPKKQKQKQKIFKCSKCDKTYKTKNGFLNHKCEVKIKKQPKKEHKCDLCKKTYKSELFFLKHKCVPKERLAKMEDAESRIAFLAYLNLYNSNTALKRKIDKTHEDFVKSHYYNYLYNFGKYVVRIGMYDVYDYITFLIKNRVNVEKWCDDNLYHMYIAYILINETPDKAIEKTFKTMKSWSIECEIPWYEYFNQANPFKVISSLKNGKISPWVIYNTESGKNFIKRLDKKQLKELFSIIDPDKWYKKFNKYESDIDTIVKILKNAGL